jgi:hypothetical protein
MYSMPINGIIQGVNYMMTLNREDKALVARGFAITASEAAFEAQGTEAALQAGNFQYEGKILDLQSEFASRRDALRREHLDAVAAITNGGG